MDNTNGTTISATMCGITTTIAYDHSDVDIHELLDAFRRVAIGLTYHEHTWKDAVIEMARQYMDEDEEIADRDARGLDDLIPNIRREKAVPTVWGTYRVDEAREDSSWSGPSGDYLQDEFGLYTQRYHYDRY